MAMTTRSSLRQPPRNASPATLVAFRWLEQALLGVPVSISLNEALEQAKLGAKAGGAYEQALLRLFLALKNQQN